MKKQTESTAPPVTLEEADALLREALDALNRASVALTARGDSRRLPVNMAWHQLWQLVPEGEVKR